MKILEYLDTGITGYDMHPMNETAFREYFTDGAAAEKFLKRTNKNNKTYSKRVFNVSNTLFEVQYNGNRAGNIAKLAFEHGEDENKYEYGEESDGTKRLIGLLSVILNEEEDTVFMIDELARSFHPQMTIKFVETFLKFSAKKNTQLIITTHESNLIDLDILRQDEIWFAEKDFHNNTNLYTLEKFKIRHSDFAVKDYLAGRYGAVPVFKDFEYIWRRE